MKAKRLITLILVLTLMLTACLALASCGGGDDPTPPTVCTSHADSDGDGICDTEGCDEAVEPQGGEEPEDASYTVEVMSEGGYRLPGVFIDVFDSASGNLVTYLKTDSEGKKSVTLPKKSTYVARIKTEDSDLVGYAVEDEYTLIDGVNEIRLKTALPAGGFSGLSLSVYDIMPDFTVTTTDGRTLTLSELLGDKKAVVLNFWYVNCNFCKQEFPDMIAAYESEIEGADGRRYRDELELIALNPIDKSLADIEDIEDTYSLSCPVAKEECGIAAAFGFTGYPATVIIDRYGMIRYVHSNPLMGTETWCDLFDTYIAEDYTQESP